MTRRLDYLTAPAVADYLRRSDTAILPLAPRRPTGCTSLWARTP